MAEHSAEYVAYLASPEWQTQRRGALERGGYRCNLCGRGRGDVVLQVHHETYARLGNELPEDLEVLCVECHAYVDDNRRTVAPFERLMTKATAYAESKIGKATWDYTEDGRVDGITEAGLALVDEYIAAHPLPGMAVGSRG